MEINQQFVVQHPVEKVWKALSDVNLIVSCVPGAEVVAVSEDGLEVDGHIRTKLGPIGAAFTCKSKITRDDSAHTGHVESSGTDKNSNSRIKIAMDYVATESDDGNSTTTDVSAKITLSGTLAQFGKGSLMNDIAAAMTTEFTKNLSASFDAPAGEDGEEVLVPKPTQALNPLKLLWSVFMSRLARIFGK